MEVLSERHNLLSCIDENTPDEFVPQMLPQDFKPGKIPWGRAGRELDLNPDNPSATAFDDDIHFLSRL